MAGDREILYRVRLAVGQAVADSRKAQQAIENISKSTASPQAAQAAARNTIRQQQRVTENQKAQIQQQVQVTQAGQQRMVQVAQQTANAQIQQQNKVTANLQQQAAQQQRAMQAAASAQASPSGGGLVGRLGGLGSLAAGGVVGYLGTIGAREIGRAAVEMTDLATKALRAEAAFRTLSGGASAAEKNIRAIQDASGGTISRLQALETGTQALSLGLAETPEQFERLTRAAMAVTQVSPIINDMAGAFSEIGLASANESFRRLDQLGLSVSEVRDRIAELRSENSELTASQAFQEAVIGTLNEKYAGLLDSVEAQATGLERLRVAAADARVELAKQIVAPSTNFIAGALVPSVEAVGMALPQAVVDWKMALNVADLETTIQYIESILDPKAFSSRIGQVVRLATGAEVDTGQLQKVVQVYEQLSEAIDLEIPGVDDYKEVFAGIADAASRGALTREGAIALDALSSSLQIATQRQKEFNEAQAEGAQQEYDLTKLRDTFRQLDTMIADAAAFTPAQLPGADELVQSLLDLKIEIAAAGTVSEESAQKLAELDRFLGMVAAGGDGVAMSAYRMGHALNDARNIAGDLSGALESQLANLVRTGAVSIEEATRIFEAQQKLIRDAAHAVANSDMSPQERTFTIAATHQQIDAKIKALEDAAKARRDINRITLDEQRAFYDQIDAMLQRSSGFGDNMLPGADKMRQDLINLRLEIAQTGNITDQQRQMLSSYSSTLDSAANAVGYLSNAQIQAAIASGNLNAALMQIPGYLDAVKIAAWQTGAAIQSVFDITNRMTGTAQSRLEALVRDGTLSAGQAEVVARRTDVLINQQATTIGYSGGSAREKAFAEAAADEVVYAEIAEIEEVSRLRKEADRQAAQEAERAFKGAAKAAGEEFKNLASDLRSIPGLFGTSSVTAEDMQKAQSGLYQDKPDEWLRRLRDEVQNGKDYEDVSIEQAREALARVGIVAAENAEDVLAQIEEAWNNSVLFADKANLELINRDAVRMQLDLQEKSRQGQANIMEHFGAVVDGAVAAATGGGGAAPPKIEIPELEIPEVEVDPRVFIDPSKWNISPLAADVQKKIGTLPQMPDGQQAALAGGSFAIESVTLPPTLGEDIAADLASQLSAQGSLFSGQGADIARYQGEGYLAYERADHAQDYFNDIGSQFQDKIDLFKGQGGAIAYFQGQGYTEYARVDHAADYASDVTTQIVALMDTFKAQGNLIGLYQEQGYTARTWGDVAGTILTTLDGQFFTDENKKLASGTGEGVVAQILSGMGGADYEAAARQILISMRDGFGTEENLNIMIGMGGGLANFLRDGMTQEIGKPGWGEAIFNEVMAAVMAAATESLEAGA